MCASMAGSTSFAQGRNICAVSWVAQGLPSTEQRASPNQVWCAAQNAGLQVAGRCSRGKGLTRPHGAHKWPLETNKQRFWRAV
eukprot:15444116-Alexandrium_andersonii.AAC.1